MLKKIRTAILVIFIIIMLIILFISGTILVRSYTNPDEVPSFLGWKPFVVLSRKYAGRD